VKYKQATTFDEAAKVAEKKEVSMEEVPRPIMQSMVKTIHFSTEPELRKHPEVRSHMESAMEQMINQMNQLSFHLLQPKTSKSINVERELLTIQCYNCREMGHYSKECPNLPALATRENASSSTQKFSAEKKGKAQMH
jgi:glycyl-tRNA synthetase (class II)